MQKRQEDGNHLSVSVLKSPLSLYLRVHIKQYPENFAFLILRLLELFKREVCKYLKK